jgi:hypothetical protein
LDADFGLSDSNLCSSGNAYCRRPSRIRQDRRLDGQPFVFAEGSQAKGRTVGSPAYPVARFPLKNFVILCEGSSDFLAAYHLAFIEGADTLLSIAAMMGAGNRISENRLKEFSGRNVLVFPDYDHAGTSAAIRWGQQLKDVAETIRFFDYATLKRDDGQPVKDLRDFLQVNTDPFECYHEVRNPLGAFLVASQSMKNIENNHG